MLSLGMAAAAVASPAFWQVEWPHTDFDTLLVDPTEIISGGPPKDGIPALSNPVFASAGSETGLGEHEPVISVEIENEFRAYPIRYLLWHEIVNDRVGGMPIAVTYCPLCNSGVVYDARLNDRELTFGVTGKLRHSDMIMYDRETESWWQQAIGQAIAGELSGEELTAIPALTVSWGEYMAMAGTDAKVMQEPKHVLRPYGANPYVGYDTADRPFLYNGENPPHGIHPLARVVRIGDQAWPLERLRIEGMVSESGYELTWNSGQVSPLDQRNINDSRDIGTVRALSAGEPVAHDLLFAFAFHAFFPEGQWMLGN
ncbi:MAG: DUF3179 domain-containing protein [Rhodobacteraceae bacterium]|nr:DUF3179 domain-containing protein [Paracoccaceae bacterium]